MLILHMCYVFSYSQTLTLNQIIHLGVLGRLSSWVLQNKPLCIKDIFIIIPIITKKIGKHLSFKI